MSEIRLIDVESVIRNSRSGFVRSLPGFVIRLIEKLIRQDEMNAVMRRNSDKQGVDFINSVLSEWNIRINVKEKENIPGEGRFVFVANHPLGGIDALSFLSTIHSVFPDVVSPSNELFRYIPNLNPVILGVNVFGTNTKETATRLNRLFESDTQVMMFPAGLVSRKRKGVIEDPEWQKTFVTKSIQYRRDIVPVHISGRNSYLFYFTASLRKMLGIKLSLEIILLPYEMHRRKNSEITLTVGKVIRHGQLTAIKSHREWALSIRKYVYSLASRS